MAETYALKIGKTCVDAPHTTGSNMQTHASKYVRYEYYIVFTIVSNHDFSSIALLFYLCIIVIYVLPYLYTYVLLTIFKNLFRGRMSE